MALKYYKVHIREKYVHKHMCIKKLIIEIFLVKSERQHPLVGDWLHEYNVFWCHMAPPHTYCVTLGKLILVTSSVYKGFSITYDME